METVSEVLNDTVTKIEKSFEKYIFCVENLNRFKSGGLKSFENKNSKSIFFRCETNI